VLSAPFCEAQWSVGIDPVVKESFPQETLNTILSELSCRDNFATCYRAIVYAKNKLEPIYKKELEKLIVSYLPTADHRILLRVATSFYCSYLINAGYSRAYIADTANKLFFANDHKRVSKAKVENFFASFTEEVMITTYIAESHRNWQRS
jgi:hypothetical protein